MKSKPTISKPQQKLIEQHMEFATAVAHNFFRDRLNFGLDREDFISAALFGLCQAALRYDPKLKGKFKTYAYFRIRGAMYDLLRRTGGISRAVFTELTSGEQNKYDPKPEESRLPYTFAKDTKELIRLETVLEQFGVRVFHSLEKDSADITYSENRDPESTLARQQMSSYLRQVLHRLPRRQQQVLSMRYLEDKSYDEMSKIMKGVSKSWLSRLHCRGLKNARRLMAVDDRIDDFRLAA